jgi:hypothetical protein
VFSLKLVLPAQSLLSPFLNLFLFFNSIY